MADKTLGVDQEVHELKFGASFDSRSNVAFHSIRYDFKPASADNSKDSLVEVGAGHQITVTVPHVEGAGTTHTVYKGNKRECPKECVLIIDHETGSFTLEKLSNNIMLKKTRIEGSSKISQSQNNRPLTPVDYNKQKMSPAKPRTTPTPTLNQISPASTRDSPSITPVQVEEPKHDNSPIGEISDSSSDDGSDSDSSDVESDKDTNKAGIHTSLQNSMAATKISTVNSHKPYNPILQSDLHLSDSSSDSD